MVTQSLDAFRLMVSIVHMRALERESQPRGCHHADGEKSRFQGGHTVPNWRDIVTAGQRDLTKQSRSLFQNTPPHDWMQSAAA